MFRSIRIDAVLIQAVIAGALSFAHLHDLAEAAGQTGWKAWAYPVSVDLLLVAVWRRLRTERSKLAWFWFLVALVASLGANVATAGLLDLDHVPAWLRILVAGWPALAFLGGTLLAHTPPERTPDAAPAPAPVPVVDRPEVPEPASEITAPEPAPALPQAPATAVPPALVDHARKVATEHRTRTGSDIDTATLRARLGIPEDLAGAIVAQLA
ncbi:SpdA protein [Streptomyces malachitofuscus]|nr:SpdA protein [Streptomyces malachitofuscus]